MSTDTSGENGAGERRRRYRLGFAGEAFASAWLMAKGYRIVARRARTPLGEIDIVAVRGGRISFIEVKARRTGEAAEASIDARQRARVRRASSLWLQRHQRYLNHEMTFDLVFILPWQWPRHLINAL